jgi:hypothetical protein
MQVTGLVHDLGKLLFFFGSQGQWDVVGDTFVVGCKFSDKIIYPDTFENNPDSRDPVYSTEYGVYKPNCGLDNVLLSWGHDEVSGEMFSISPFPPSLAITDPPMVWCDKWLEHHAPSLLAPPDRRLFNALDADRLTLPFFMCSTCTTC